MGNITTISKNGIKQKEYKYDTLGRIIYENNLDTNREISYTYDRQGNILSKTENGTKLDYTYDQNGFKLLSFGDQAYSYDNLGNPLNLNSTYYGASWTKARLLTTLNASSHNVNFTYDGTGLMTGKSIGGSSSYYNYIPYVQLPLHIVCHNPLFQKQLPLHMSISQLTSSYFLPMISHFSHFNTRLPL